MIAAGQVWQRSDIESMSSTRARSVRRVVGLVHDRDRGAVVVVYSIGSDRNYQCTERTFERWKRQARRV